MGVIQELWVFPHISFTVKVLVGYTKDEFEHHSDSIMMPRHRNTATAAALIMLDYYSKLLPNSWEGLDQPRS